MEKRHHGASAATPNKPHVFSKMEALVREMQDPETGVPIRPQKIFLTSIPAAFMGYDLIEWLIERLDMNDSAEAIHLANLLCQYGYFFPVGETRSLIVKDDSSLYRFQTPYYWASQNHSADTTDYAIYLTKRLAKNKQKHGLEDYEVDAYTKLKKGLQHKWDFVTMQADEQVRLAKDRKKGDKIVTDSQERAYWRVYRPPPGFNNCLESAPVPDRGNVANRVRKKTLEERKKEVEFYAEQIGRVRMKVSQALESLVTYYETFAEFDFFLTPPAPSNPWITEDITFWSLNESIVEVPTEKRVKKWAISFSALISDPTGLLEFTNYLRKEYCHENIRFWQAVNELRYGTNSQVPDKVKHIYEEFLKPGAPCEINIDCKTMEATQQQMKNPTRFTYDAAAEHVYVLLLKKDCYPRYLRSEQYKSLLANAIQPLQKKRFFSFGGPGKKKAMAVGSNSASTLQAQTPQPLKRHGSDEHTALTSGMTFGASDIVGPTLALHPRVDCDQPYSSSKSTEQLEKTDDICPWDTTPILSVVPYKGEPPLQKMIEDQKTEKKDGLEVEPKSEEIKESPKKQPILKEKVESKNSRTQQKRSEQRHHARFHQSLPHNAPVKQTMSHFKPPRPDRSRSVDVNPVAETSTCYPPTLNTRPKLSVTSPIDSDKKGTDKVLKETSKDHTSLLPTSSYPCYERRASEGSRIYSRHGTAPPATWKEEESLVIVTPTSIDIPESPLLQESPDPFEKSSDVPASPLCEKRIQEVDYSVRSAHFTSQHVLPSSPNKETIIEPGSSSSSPMQSSIAQASSISTNPIEEGVSSVQLNIEKDDDEECSAEPLNIPSVSPSSPHEAQTWQESPSQKVTDICPWEDDLSIKVSLQDQNEQLPTFCLSRVPNGCQFINYQLATLIPFFQLFARHVRGGTKKLESCKLDAPFVKTYATLGYL